MYLFLYIIPKRPLKSKIFDMCGERFAKECSENLSFNVFFSALCSLIRKINVRFLSYKSFPSLFIISCLCSMREWA